MEARTSLWAFEQEEEDDDRAYDVVEEVMACTAAGDEMGAQDIFAQVKILKSQLAIIFTM